MWAPVWAFQSIADDEPTHFGCVRCGAYGTRRFGLVKEGLPAGPIGAKAKANGCDARREAACSLASTLFRFYHSRGSRLAERGG